MGILFAAREERGREVEELGRLADDLLVLGLPLRVLQRPFEKDKVLVILDAFPGVIILGPEK